MPPLSLPQMLLPPSLLLLLLLLEELLGGGGGGACFDLPFKEKRTGEKEKVKTRHEFPVPPR